jgi:hypothetical protein
LKVAVTDGRGRPWPSRALGPWLSAHAPARARGRVTIALITDAAMRRMNAHYRAADYATDVLSFPSETPGDPGTSPLRVAWRPVRPGLWGTRKSLRSGFWLSTASFTFWDTITSGIEEKCGELKIACAGAPGYRRA